MATLACLIPTPPLAVELATHFRPQLALGGALIALGHALLRCRWAALLCLACTLFHAIPVLTLWWPAAPPPGGGMPLRVMVANVHSANTNTASLIEQVRRERPDVLIALEVNQRWEQALSELSAELPHQLSHPRHDNFGIMLLSRHRPDQTEIRYLDGEVPTIIADLTVGGRPIRLVGTHPLPPISEPYFAARNLQLERLVALVDASPAPVVLVGDLNITPWAAHLSQLRSPGRLHDARAGFGLQPTWPAPFGALGIPIDHILISPELGVIDCHAGDGGGSDHRPLMATLVIPE